MLEAEQGTWDHGVETLPGKVQSSKEGSLSGRCFWVRTEGSVLAAGQVLGNAQKDIFRNEPHAAC